MSKRLALPLPVAYIIPEYQDFPLIVVPLPYLHNFIDTLTLLEFTVTGHEQTLSKYRNWEQGTGVESPQHRGQHLTSSSRQNSKRYFEV